MKYKIVIILILIAAIFGAGFYFKNDAVRFYNNLGKEIQNWGKTDIGSTISEIGKQVLTPPPLQIKRKFTEVVLEGSKVIEETNLQRKLNGDLPALSENTSLNTAALAKANDMFQKQYFEHISPDGTGPGQLVMDYGYSYIVAGENLILGNFISEEEMVQDWMNSPGHRANILNSKYTEIGVAVIKGTYKGDSVWIGVQEFGLPLSVCPNPDDSLKSRIDFNKSTLESLSSQIDNIRSQIDDMSPKRLDYKDTVDAYNQLVESYNKLSQETKNLISQYNEQVSNFNSCVTAK